MLLTCCDFKLAHMRLADSVRLQGSKAVFKLHEDGLYFYHSAAGSYSKGKPQVGDARVQFKYVPNHTATMLALQVHATETARHTFLPYRLISRGLLGTAEEEEKKALLRQAQKSSCELASDAACRGIFGLLCCACNLVTMCFSSLLTAQLYHIFPDSADTDKCFRSVNREMQTTKWFLRFIGWSMMFIGLYSLFAPLLTLMKVILFFGPLVASLGGFLIFFLCLICTAIVASIIVIVAYSYHPLMALIYSAITVGAVGGVCWLAVHI